MNAPASVPAPELASPSKNLYSQRDDCPISPERLVGSDLRCRNSQLPQNLFVHFKNKRSAHSEEATSCGTGGRYQPSDQAIEGGRLDDCIDFEGQERYCNQAPMSWHLL